MAVRRQFFPKGRTWFALLLLVYIFAFGVRFNLWTVHPYGDEAAHYYVARHLGNGPEHVRSVNFDFPADKAPFLSNLDTRPLFYQRPMFSLLLWPGAVVSFEAYRLLHIALTSLIPVAAILLLRQMETRTLLAAATGLLLAVNPLFVTWGTLVFPDSLMTLALAASVLAARRDRPITSAGLLLAAIWIKEVAIVAALFLLAHALLRGRRLGQTSLWPLRLDRLQTGYLVVVLVALGPLLYSQFLGGLFPGWGRGGEIKSNIDRFFLQLWLLPVILAGLRWPRTRFLSGLALLYPAFFLAYRILLGRGLAIWHFPPMQFFAAAAATLVLDEWWTRARAKPSRALRFLPQFVALILAGLLAIQISVPETQAPRSRLTMPLSGLSNMSLPEALRYEKSRDHDLHEVLIRLQEQTNSGLFLVDVGWFYILHPISGLSATIYYGYTEVAEAGHQDPAFWSSHLERGETLALLFTLDVALNEAIRTVYADCRIYQNPSFELFNGSNCAGRADQLRAKWDELREGA